MRFHGFRRSFPSAWVALAAIAFLGMEAGAASAAAAVPALQHVLVFEKRVPTSTEPYTAADSLIARLGRAQGFTVRYTRDSLMINRDTLARYQIVVWNNVMRNVLSADQQDAFQHYMENGGGYVGFHAAGTNRRIWPWYVDQLLGGDNHDQASIAWGSTVMFADTVARPGHTLGVRHPIMRGAPAVIPQYGEWYNWNPNPADNPEITVLQWYRPKSVRNSWPDALPVTWCREYGSGPVKGRLFYTQASHVDTLYTSAWYGAMIGNALRWVAREGESTAAIAPSAPGTGRRPASHGLAAWLERLRLLNGRAMRALQ